MGDAPSLGAMDNNPRAPAVAQFFIVQHFVKPAGAAAAFDMALYPAIAPTPTLGKYRCRIGLEFRDGPALAAIGTEEYGVRGEAGKVVFKPGLRRIPVQTIEQCLDGLVVLWQVLRNSSSPVNRDNGDPGARRRCLQGWQGWVLVGNLCMVVWASSWFAGLTGTFSFIWAAGPIIKLQSM